MFLVGRISRDSEYDYFQGLSQIRVFVDFEEAKEFVLKNLEVTVYLRETMYNPAHAQWIKDEVAKGHKYEKVYQKNPVPYTIPHSEPYHEVFVDNPWAILEGSIGEPFPEAVTVDPETSNDVLHHLFQEWDGLIFQIPVR